MPRWVVLIALAGLGGCFDPSYGDIPCGPGGSCPDGRVCGSDNICRRAGEPTESDAAVDDPPDAARPDAARPDAMPVECEEDGPCQTPPTACLLPGTCNTALNRCEFPTRTCEDLDDECNVGVCDDAAGCVAQPRNEGDACTGSEGCGPDGACDTEGDVCDRTGLISRTCPVFTCQGGACTHTSDRIEVEPCEIDTNGVGCGTDTDCEPCSGFDDVCDEEGTQQCTDTPLICADAVCSPGTPSGPYTRECTRDTDGRSCGAPGFRCQLGECVCALC